MIFKPFLTSEDISSLQIQEAQSSKKQKRTPEQIEAIYSYGNNILVSASAGSGKTFVMVERIIDKILRGVTIDQLEAISPHLSPTVQVRHDHKEFQNAVPIHANAQ